MNLHYRNDTCCILRDVSADVKKFCAGREASTTALRSKRSSIDESSASARTVVHVGEYATLREEVRHLAAAVAANTQTLSGIQASWRPLHREMQW